MNPRALHVLALLAGISSGILSGGSVLAQTPVKPPPWWAVQDAVTLSAWWDFAGGVLSPTFVVASPAWYNPLVTGPTSSPNVVPIPTLSGHSGCIGMIGTGVPQVGTFAMKVDNDPHLNWVKIFWFQFDVFEGTSGDIKSGIKQDLARYGRAIVHETSEPIGQGWERVTVSAELIPQPDDETIEWTFTENASGTIAIDNLFVCSKCVKPGPDQDGTALGVVDVPPVDLTALFPGVECLSAAVTEGPAPTFTPTYWIGARSTAAGPHQLVRYQGTVTGSTPLPSTAVQAPFGACGLTVETLSATPTPQQFVHALVDNRAAPGGFATLHRIDTTGAIVGTTPLVAFPPIAQVPLQDFGLAFDPSGDTGAGSFWVSTQAGTAFEFNRAGTAILDQRAIPPGCAGIGYDDTLGYFYGFSNTPRPAPPGLLQVNGFEWSGFDFQTTGVEFCGDIRIPNPGGPPGGIARGFEVYRPRGSATSQLRMVCVVEVSGPVQSRKLLYVLAGPYRFGWSQIGNCGMSGGAPFVGSPSFQVTLTGVPNTLGAVLFIGFSNQTYLGVPLPFPLAGIGWPESYMSVSPDLSTPLLAPTAPGSFRFPLGLPPGIGLSYTPLFFQWIVLDTQVPGFLAASQAGKTVAY